jgi:hypothetical protein
MKAPYVCTGCGLGAEGNRLPPGWKDVAGKAMCKDCFRRHYAVRACTLPVAEPVGSSWEALWEALHPAWRLSTGAANWAVQQLYRLDTHGQAATPPAVKQWYAYGEAKKHYPEFAAWEGAKASLNICLRAAHRKYLQGRFAVMVRHEQSLLTYRYPYPFPVDADDWAPAEEAGGFPAVSLNLPGAGGWRLRLRRRADFGRQLAMFRQLLSGEALKGEAAVYKNGKGDVLLKLVGWFPRQERGPAANVAFVHTDPSALLVVEVNGRAAGVTNGDHIRREIARHKAMLERTRQDKKREVRMDRRQRRHLDKHVAARCEKQRNRLDTYVKQVAAQVARMCERQQVALVAYDDAEKGFMPDGFPWHSLSARLRQLIVTEQGREWVDGRFAHTNDGTTREDDAWSAVRKAKATATAGRRALAAARRKGSHPAVSTGSPKTSSSPTPTTRPRRARP